MLASHCDGVQVQSRAAYLLFYRRRAQAQQDPADLVPQLLEQRQQHLAAKEAAAQQAAEQEAAAAHDAAARAAAGCGSAAAAAGPSAMDADGPDVMAVDTDATAAAESTCPGLVISPLDTTQEGWGSPALGTPAGPAAAAAGEGIGGALLGMNSPAPAPPAQAGGYRTGPSRRVGAVDDSSDTSTSLRNPGLEEGDSSDGSSSRPRHRPGVQQRQREAAEAQAAAEAVDSWGPLQGGPQRPARPSDQDADADMADRDV